jgi:hypothetical protein
MQVVKEENTLTFEELRSKLMDKEGIVLFVAKDGKVKVLKKKYGCNNKWSWHTLWYDGGIDNDLMSHTHLEGVISWLKTQQEVHWFETEEEAIRWWFNQIERIN